MPEKRNRGDRIDQMAKALAHPLRVKILRQLEEGPSSPNQVAHCIGEKLGNVSYHMKVLRNLGCVELVDTTPRRGFVEHFYKLNSQGALGSATWKEVPASLRSHHAGSALADFTTRAIESLDAGTAESREGSGVTSLPLTVDEQGWQELRLILGNIEERFRAAAGKSAERMESPRDGFPVIVAVAAFEIARGKDVDPS
jgi:DNA-binding transcriptional ArsR family regulator